MKKSLLMKKYLKEIEGQEQYPPLSNARPFTQINGWNSAKYFSKYYDDKLPLPDIFVSKNGQGIFYLPETKIKNLAREVFIKFWNDQTIVEKKLETYKKLESEVEELYEKYAIQNKLDTSIREIIEDLRRAKDSTWSLNALVFFSIYFDEDLAGEMLEIVGANISKERLRDLWTIISVPICDSFDTRRKKIFLLENSKKVSMLELARNLRFIEASYDHVPELDEIREIFSKKYSDWLDSQKSISEFKRENKKSLERKENWNNKMEEFNKEERKLAKYLQWVITLRDERKDVISKFLTVVYVIGSYLFKKANLSLDLLYYSPMDEWISDVDALKKSESRFKQIRDNAVILINWNGEVEFEFGTADEVLSIMNKNLKADFHEGANVLRGQSGYPGKVIGTIKIVRDMTEEAGKFSKGDILITGMTRPEFVPLMKKSSAIITDEGGVTCHAAIVAREMKKPCIIGTKIATQVLKDGDEVEVDAEKGIVKILKKI